MLLVYGQNHGKKITYHWRVRNGRRRRRNGAVGDTGDLVHRRPVVARVAHLARLVDRGDAELEIVQHRLDGQGRVAVGTVGSHLLCACEPLRTI